MITKTADTIAVIIITAITIMISSKKMEGLSVLERG